MSVCLFLSEAKALLLGAALPGLCLFDEGCCGAGEASAAPGAARASLSAAWSTARRSEPWSLSVFSLGEEKRFVKGGKERKDCFARKLLRFIVLKGLAKFLEINLACNFFEPL